MIYKKALICKTKNLFDISKVVQSSNIKSDNRDITCSSYGASIGLLKDLCPSLKAGDIVTLSLKVKSTTGVAPNFVQIQGQILYFKVNTPTFTVTEAGLNSNFYIYNTTYEHMGEPTTSVYTDIMIELGSTPTSYVPYGYLQSYKKAIKVSDVFVNSYKSTVICKTKNLCDFTKLFNSTIDKQFDYLSFWQVEISVKSNTEYTLSRLNNDVINLGPTYLGMDNVSSGSHGSSCWLNHNGVPSYCRKSITLTSSSDGKLWIFFSKAVYNAYTNGQNPFGYLQLEEGSTATSYVPYGHL